MKIYTLKNILTLLTFLSLPAIGLGMDFNFEEDFKGPLFPGEEYIVATYRGAQSLALSAYRTIASFASKPQTHNVMNACGYVITNPAAAISDISSIGLNFAKAKAKEQKEQAEILIQKELNAGVAVVNKTVKDTIISPLKKYVKIGAGAAVGGIAFYYTAKFIARKIEEMRRIPRLAYKSSEKSFLEQLNSLVDKSHPLSMLEVILSLENTTKFNEIVNMAKFISFQNASSANSLDYRNLLLCGPSGTGKSMFAQNLAIALGMDYYMFKADVLLSEQSNQQTQTLQALMSWAEQKTKNGKLIFIDDVDVLLDKYDQAVVKNFLDYIRLGSKQSMFVFSTNILKIDQSMNLCVADIVRFDLPNMQERIAILNHYINIYMLHEGILPAFADSVLSVLQQEKVAQIATAAEGFSGEALRNYIKTVMTLASSYSVVLSNEIVDETLRQAIVKHNQFANHSVQ